MLTGLISMPSFTEFIAEQVHLYADIGTLGPVLDGRTAEGLGGGCW